MDTIRVQKLKGKDKHDLTDADDDVDGDAHKDHDDAGEDYEGDVHGDNDIKYVGTYMLHWQHCHKSVSKNEMIWDVTCQYINVADLG